MSKKLRALNQRVTELESSTHHPTCGLNQRVTELESRMIRWLQPLQPPLQVRSTGTWKSLEQAEIDRLKKVLTAEQHDRFVAGEARDKARQDLEDLKDENVQQAVRMGELKESVRGLKKEHAQVKEKLDMLMSGGQVARFEGGPLDQELIHTNWRKRLDKAEALVVEKNHTISQQAVELDGLQQSVDVLLAELDRAAGTGDLCAAALEAVQSFRNMTQCDVPWDDAGPTAPKDWDQHHHKDCGTRYRGCHPRLCPKDQYEETGVWRTREELELGRTWRGWAAYYQEQAETSGTTAPSRITLGAQHPINEETKSDD